MNERDLKINTERNIRKSPDNTSAKDKTGKQKQMKKSASHRIIAKPS